eukprot:TRINITY_DN1364_c1_g1_i6.p1 TRINITY_DN1364_c1_g1~~TRINITY_DN1364_c1_g1_i6.p1  ORF type:complete len:802 (-),score=89.12 TRINITY_DN1364_c1_g1_i6:88-2493(-)
MYNPYITVYRLISPNRFVFFEADTIIGKPNSWQIVIGIGGTMQFMVYTSSGTVGSASFSQVPQNSWMHVAGVYDGTTVFLYVNGIQRGNATQGGLFTDAQNVPIVSQFNGNIDEVKIFSYAISAGEVYSGFNATNTITPVDVSLGNVPTLIVNQTYPLSPQSDQGATRWQWSIIGGDGCSSVTIEDSTARTMELTVSELGNYQLGLSVWTQDVCSSTGSAFEVAGLAPAFTGFILSGPVFIIDGDSVNITVNVTGAPEPTVQWQQLMDVPSEVDDVHVRGVDIHNFWSTSSSYNWNFGRATPLLPSCDFLGRSSNCSRFVDIVNATSTTFTTPIGTADLNGTIIRVQATNFVTTTSDNITLFTLPASSTGDGGGTNGDGGGNDVGVLVGSIVGSILGACAICCCLLLILVLLILFLGRRSSSQEDAFLGEPPDYDKVVYGAYLSQLYRGRGRNRDLGRLEQMLVQDREFALAKAFAYAHGMEDENVARSLMYIFHDHSMDVSLIKMFILQEIQKIEPGQATMFRSNTITPRLFKHFALIYAVEFLWETLAPYVWEIQQNAAIVEGETEEETDEENFKSKRYAIDLGMEIDPSKMPEAADKKINTLQLWLTAQKIFSAITRSFDILPADMREVLAYVHDEVAGVVPGEEFKALGAFLFLRFFCPALLAPQYFGLLEEAPLPTAQRQLILLAKVLQNLANDTLPGIKEVYMARLNEFITNNQEDLRNYFNRTLAADNLPIVTRQIPAVAKENALCCLYNKIAEDRRKVDQRLQEQQLPRDHPLWRELDALLQDAAPIPRENRE